MTEDWRADVLRFWFGLDPQQWFRGGDALDHQVRENFLELWEAKRELPASSFLDDPLTALAATIMFDQFSRNMFRDHADQFSTDHLALQIAREALDREFDQQLRPEERTFLYLPFEHSEDLADQDRSVLLFKTLGNEEQLDYAKRHHDVIARFGRFPHRNKMLGRAPRPAELAAGDIVPW